MKNIFTIVAVCLVLTAGNAVAVQVEAYSTSAKDVALVESQSSFSFEFNAEGTYVGKGDVRQQQLVPRGLTTDRGSQPPQLDTDVVLQEEADDEDRDSAPGRADGALFL